MMQCTNPNNIDVNKIEPEHGPGPPETPTFYGNDIEKLQSELRTCKGKLKGYETLGHLYQESRQECIRYQQKNEELAKRLDSLTRRLLPSENLNEPTAAARTDVESAPVTHSEVWHDTRYSLSHNTTPSSHAELHVGSDKRTNDSMIISGLGNIHRPSVLPSALPTETREGMVLNLKDSDAIKVSTADRGHTPASSTSSPSFVQISGSGADTPSSLLSITNDHSSQRQDAKERKKPQDEDVVRATSIDLSSEVNEISEHLKTLGHSSGTSVGNLASDLVKAGVHVIKLQKHNRVLQILLDQANSQVADLKADIVTKHQAILMLQKDCDAVRNTVKRMETTHTQALRDAQVKLDEVAEKQNEPMDGPNSAEWVEVENQTGGDMVAGKETAVTAVPMVEMELRRRIEKLNATISELVSVNRSWDEHCRQLQSTHNLQMTALQTKLNDAERRLEEYEKADVRRQQEFDNILLNAKKQRETEEMAKEDALNRLHSERRQRTQAEEKCIELSRKTAELENRLLELHQSKQVELAQSFRRSHEVQPLSDREQELSLQLLVLQEQVRVFKEDFDQERRDREQARTKMESLQQRLSQTSDQLTSVQARLQQSVAELNSTKSERDHYRQRFQKLSDDLQALQRQARPAETWTPFRAAASFPRDVTRPSAVHPQFEHTHNYYVRDPDWICTRCTYSNPGRRSSCEICGRAKITDFPTPNNAYLVDGRTVAGLQISHSATPYASQRARSLEMDGQPADRCQ